MQGRNTWEKCFNVCTLRNNAEHTDFEEVSETHFLCVQLRKIPTNFVKQKIDILIHLKIENRIKIV